MANLTPLRGSSREIVYCQETTPGVTPINPTMKPLRCLPNTSFQRSVAALESNEWRPSRQKPLPQLGKVTASGSIEAEYSFGTYDDFIAAAMESNWSTAVTKTAITLSASATDNSFNDSASGFVSAGFAVGDIVQGVGWTNAANNGLFRITALTAGKMTVTGAARLVTEAAGSSRTVKRPLYLTVGKTMKSFTFEERYASLIPSSGAAAVGMRHVGQVVNGMSLKVGTESLVGLSFSLMGRDTIVSEAVAGTTFSAVASDHSFNDSASGFGAFKVDDVIKVTGFTNAGNNGLFRITAVTAGKITVAGSLVNEAAGSSVLITTQLPAAGSSISTTEQFAGVSDAHLFYEGGAQVATVSDFSFELNNNCKAYHVVGSRGTAAVTDEVVTVTGQTSFLIENLNLYKACVAEQATSLEATLVDLDGNKMRHVFPSIRFTDSPLDATGSAVMSNIPWTAGESAVYGTCLIIIKEAA